MAHFLCHLGCSHFGALLLDFYFTENNQSTIDKLSGNIQSGIENIQNRLNDLEEKMSDKPEKNQK